VPQTPNLPLRACRCVMVHQYGCHVLRKDGDGCDKLVGTTAGEAAQLTAPDRTSSSRPPWQTLVTIVAASSLLLAGAMAGAMAATGGRHIASMDADASSDSLALYSESYEDPRGQTVCPASRTSKGSCKCACNWAKERGACEQRRDDGTCCYSCCCPNSGAHLPAQGGMGFLEQQPDDIHHAVDETYPSSLGAPPHVATHVTHHYDHYHAINEGSFRTYHVGERVYVKASDGREWAARIIASNMDGTYQVRYLADHYHGRSVLVSASSIVRHPGFLSPQHWWIVFGCTLVALCGFACYIYKSAPR